MTGLAIKFSGLSVPKKIIIGAAAAAVAVTGFTFAMPKMLNALGILTHEQYNSLLQDFPVRCSVNGMVVEGTRPMVVPAELFNSYDGIGRSFPRDVITIVSADGVKYTVGDPTHNCFVIGKPAPL